MGRSVDLLGVQYMYMWQHTNMYTGREGLVHSIVRGPPEGLAAGVEARSSPGGLVDQI